MCVSECVCVYWLHWFGVGIVMGVVVDVGVVGSESVFVSPLSYSKLVIGELCNIVRCSYIIWYFFSKQTFEPVSIRVYKDSIGCPLAR